MTAAKATCDAIDQDSQGEPADTLDLLGEAAEGGSANVYRPSRTATRITGELLGEAQRWSFDYRYHNGVLVCATEVVTTANTVTTTLANGDPSAAPTIGRMQRFRVFLVSETALEVALDEQIADPTGWSPPFRTPDPVRFAERLLELAERRRANPAMRESRGRSGA